MRIDFSKAQSIETCAQAGLNAARGAAGRRLALLIETAMTELSGPLPLEEKLAFPAKEAAARALLAGEAAAAQLELISVEAEAAGETPEALARRVVARAGDWHAALARLTGLRRRVAAAVAGAATPEAVEEALALAEQLVSGQVSDLASDVLPAAGAAPVTA